MTQLLCSVVVPTYNRSRSVLRLLESLTLQDLPPESFEVIVVDDGSTDDTWNVLREVQAPYELRVFSQRNQGPAAARNTAIRDARAPLIVTLDDDVVPMPGVLRQHVAAHAAEPDIAAVGVMAPTEHLKMKPWAAWELQALKGQYRAMQDGAWDATPRQFYTANASVSRRNVIAAGLFDTHFRRSEDMELAYRLRRLGTRFRFLPDAVVYHDPPRSFSAWKKMAHDLGFYELEIWRKFGHDDMAAQIRREFSWRPPSIRRLVQLLVGQPALVAAYVLPASIVSHALYVLGLRKFSRLGYSSLFQILYWQGVCESLGDRKELLVAVASNAPAQVAPGPGRG